jgi:lambda repressor-like predicted transcriptional regulator
LSQESLRKVKVRTSRRAKRVRDDEVDHLVDLYRSGEAVKDLATRFNLHRDTVGAILNRRGVIRRARGIPKDRLPGVVTACREGSSLDMIARDVGVATNTVAAALRRAGEVIRPPVRR